MKPNLPASSGRHYQSSVQSAPGRDERHENESRSTARGTVVLVGGDGGMSSRYRDIVEERGLTLRHYEKRIPANSRRGGKAALIIVIISMVSHPLCRQAQELADRDTPIVYLRSSSVSALRNVFDANARSPRGEA